MHTTLRLMATEARSLRAGGETVITRLCDVLIVQAIRTWMSRDPAARRGWIGALHDPQVGWAISLVHRDPARAWTVESLAHEVALSRSAFSARFSELVGESPMAYVARWRMQVARAWLTEADMTVSRVAMRLGTVGGGVQPRLQAHRRSTAGLGQGPLPRGISRLIPGRAMLTSGSRHHYDVKAHEPIVRG